MRAFLLCMVFCKCTFNWQVYLVQPLLKFNDFQNRHLAVLFMKAITLYKAPLLKNMLYCTVEHFLLKSVQNLPACCASLQNPRLSWKQTKTKLPFQLCRSFHQKLQRFIWEYCSLPFSPPFGNFWSVYTLILNHQLDTEGVCNVCEVWKLCSIPI